MSRDALIVGINTYQHLPSLQSPAADAEALARLLEQYGEFTVTRLPAVKDKEHNLIRVGQKTPVTLNQLEAALVRLFKPEGRSIPDTALIFFSGHGLRRDVGIQEGFLASSEAGPKSGVRGLSLQWLRRLLQESEIRQQVIWLDCCYSGELLNFAEADPGHLGRGRDRCFIAASREFEVAYEETAGSHGVLTGALLDGLDPTRQPAGVVNNTSLSDFIARRLRAAIQRPIFTNSGEPIILTRSDTPAPISRERTDKICPYKGLRYFDCNEEDPKYFYGRTSLTDQLIEKVRQGNFLAVLGPSGSGKSSVVRAGLLHQLKLGRRLSGSEAWPIHIFRPGEHPLKSLALAFLDPNLSTIERARQLDMAEELIGKGAEGLARLIQAAPNGGRAVLMVDQFEEVFTLCRDIQERQAFFACILGALTLLDIKICLIITLRADFFSKCAEQEYSGLSGHIEENLVTITPMTADELKQAIVQPARKVGLKVQPELVDQMIENVKDSPGSLPLLQYTLTELWNIRQSDELVLTEYTRMGGVKSTLAKRADAVYANLSEEEQAIAKRIFIQLTQLGEGTEDTRRQVLKQSLTTSPKTASMVNEVIQKLADAKLIITTEVQVKGDASGSVPVVDVAHEALIRHWPLLRTWLNENRDEIRFHRRLEEAALYWDNHRQAEGLLWRSPDLEMMEDFHKKHSHEMSPVEIDFYRSSIEAKARTEKEKEAIRQREIAHARTLAEEQERRAKAQEEAARKERELRKNAETLAEEQKQRVKAQAEASKQQKRAIFILVVLVIAVGITAFLIYRDAKKSEAYAQEQKQLKLKADEERNKAQQLLAKNYRSNALSAKKENDWLKALHYFARSGKEDINISSIKNRILDTRLHLNSFLNTQIKHEGSVWGAVFSQDERRILTWSGDGTARLWQTTDGAPIGQPMKHERSVRGAVFSQDERRILTWSRDGTARLWQATDGAPIGQPMKHKYPVNGAVFSQDERRILT